MSQDTHILRLEGELTIYTVSASRQQLLAALDQHPALDLDLSLVTEIDGAGVQLLMSARKQALALDKPFQLSKHSVPVLDMWDRLDLAAWFGDPLILPARD